MMTLEIYYDAPSQCEYDAILESMTLEERHRLDKLVNAVIGNSHFSCSTDRLLAKDFFIKGFLASNTRTLTEQEKQAQYEALRK